MKIKFRAWDKDRGEKGIMLENHTLKTISICKLGEQEHLIWMQFTGLLDKNGKEIYVGDICKASWGKYEDTDVVELDEIIYAKFECTLGDLEVIGNIYENPELLNGNN